MFKKKFPSLASLGSDGNTAFLRAARAGHLDKVLEHLKANIDINTSNTNGLNALHLASKDGHIAVVTELLRRGASVDAATKKGNTALHIASLAGQEEVVKLLVANGAAVNVQSQNGFTPLYMAAQENHDNVVRFLLANGANQSLATEDGFTPLAVAMQQGHDKVVAVLLESDTRGKVRLPALHIAAKKDDCKAAALLLQNEHNPDVTSKSGFTPLHIAAHYGNESIATLLLNRGADVNYSAKHNITPLHVAAKWGKTNMVSVLLEKGANIESKTRDGLTPLHCAARSGHEQVVDMMLERGAPISSKTKNGLAPLHMASQGDHVDAARILLYHRAPVDEVTVDYLTALHVAAHCGHVRVAKLLLDRKADPNARALNGFTPLHIACKKNRIKVVELLLKHGASIEATTESGLTPLHVASFMGCMNIVIYLLQHDASPDVPTVRGETPLHLAARANQTDIIRILLRNGAEVDARAREQQTPLHIASRLGNVDIVMLLLQHGAHADSTTKDMYTALHIAAKEGQEEVASVLLEGGASLTATTKKGFTPLHLAAKYGNMKVAKLLLQRDAPVDAQAKNAVTPLHVASHYDHQNVALLLLDKGASPHATAKNGHTPLHIAARKNQMDIATTLLEYGAKANAESKAGFTPLHLSAQEGHTDMSTLLLEHGAGADQRAKNGLSPLHLCAQEDRVNVAHVLVKNGAEVDATTKAGYTPLHVASHFGQMNMVRMLLNAGASPKASTAIGYTPLHQAAQQGHTTAAGALLDSGADPNAVTSQGQTALSIAQKLGYISVVETLKGVTDAKNATPLPADEKYRVVAPETMQETFMSDSEDEGGEDTMLSDQPYRYLTVDEMKSLGDDSLPIDVTRDERIDSNKEATASSFTTTAAGPPTAVGDDPASPKDTAPYAPTPYYPAAHYAADNVDLASRHPVHVGKLHWKNFLVSFLVDARGGAMRGCRHSGVRVIVPPRKAAMPTRVTCRYLKRDKLTHPPPLMEGEALASRILELGPVGAKFLGPVVIEVPHFGSLRGAEREIVVLRSDNGETWREHSAEASEDAVREVLQESFEGEELAALEEAAPGRTTRILTSDFPQYFAIVSRVRQEVHAIGPEGGMVSSSVVPQVQAVFPQGALTKKIKVGLQAQPIPADLTAKLLGNRVAVSPIVTVEPRRRKFHKPITLTIPVPQAANKGMINQYSGDAPTLRLLCSITGGTTRAQWEDVTGSTPLTFVNDCVSFTTTVSARFWLMDCRNIAEATKMATELYKEAIHVPFMAKFVVFAKRVDALEARLRVFCMTDDKEDKTLEQQEHFTEVAKSRDVEVLEGKAQYMEFAGNLVPVTKSGDQLQLGFRAFRENRLPFTVRVKDPHADTVGRMLFMREPKVPKGEPPQQPVCILNIVLPETIVPDSGVSEPDLLALQSKYRFLRDGVGRPDAFSRASLRLADISNLLGDDWVPLALQLGLTTSDVNIIKSQQPGGGAHQAMAMLRLWLRTAGNKATSNTLEAALRKVGRDDVVQQCIFNTEAVERAVARVRADQAGFDALKEEIGPSRDASLRRDAALDAAAAFEEQDIMKESESVEELVQAEKTEPRKEERVAAGLAARAAALEALVADKLPPDVVGENERERDETKYIGEEKTVVEEERRTVAQLKEIFAQDKRDRQYERQPRSATQAGSDEDASSRLSSSTMEDSTADEDTMRARPPPSAPAPTDAERRDSTLFEGVSQELARLDTTYAVTPAPESVLSPKVSKTPPPSPAEFKETAGPPAWQSGAVPPPGVAPTECTVRPCAEDETEGSRREPIVGPSAESPQPSVPRPRPSPRSAPQPPSPLTLTRTDPDDTVTETLDEQEVRSYSDRKKFWEQMTGATAPPPTPAAVAVGGGGAAASPRGARTATPLSVAVAAAAVASAEAEVESDPETTATLSDSTVRAPAPRAASAISKQSTFTGSSDASDREGSPEPTPAAPEPAPRLPRGESQDSEAEYLAKVERSELAFDNTAFEEEKEEEDHVTEVAPPTPHAAPTPRHARSASLPACDLDPAIASVRDKKKYFEAQMRPGSELAEEEEAEASPEHKALQLRRASAAPALSSERLVTRQIHSDIFHRELEERIEECEPEAKALPTPAAALVAAVPAATAAAAPSAAAASVRALAKAFEDDNEEAEQRRRLKQKQKEEEEEERLKQEAEKKRIREEEEERRRHEERLRIEAEEKLKAEEEERRRQREEQDRQEEIERLKHEEEERQRVALELETKREEETKRREEENARQQVENQRLQEEEQATITRLEEAQKREEEEEDEEEEEEEEEQRVGAAAARPVGLPLSLAREEVSLTCEEVVSTVDGPALAEALAVVDKSETEDSEKARADVPAITVTLSGKQRTDSDSEDTACESDVTPEERERAAAASDAVWGAPEPAPPPPTASDDHQEQEQEQEQDKRRALEGEAREVAVGVLRDLEAALAARPELSPERGPPPPSAPAAESQVAAVLARLAEEAPPPEMVRAALERRLTRGDTAATASSVEITDEDLRSSGADTDLSPPPLEADDELEKTLAEVRESLGAAQESLLSERGGKQKPSPSEFEFKALTLESSLHEHIEEAHAEDTPQEIEGSLGFRRTEAHQRGAHVAQEDKRTLLTQCVAADGASHTQEAREERVAEAHADAASVRDALRSADAERLVAGDFASQRERTLETRAREEERVDAHGARVATRTQHASARARTATEESAEETSVESAGETRVEGSVRSDVTAERSESSDEWRHETHTTKQHVTTTTTTHHEQQQQRHSTSETTRSATLFKVDVGALAEQRRQAVQRTSSSEESQRSLSQDESTAKSPEDTTTSSASSTPGRPPLAAAAAPALPQPPPCGAGGSLAQVVLRRAPTGGGSSSLRGAGHDHRRSAAADLESAWSSSGESHYHSFEQTSESGRSYSRPCSSDVEMLLAAAGGGTAGSSEYESALTSLTSQELSARSADFHTAVSSFSSRDSMKSLDSESSGHLASVEVSSEASETLVPSALELERDMEDVVEEPYDTHIPTAVICGERALLDAVPAPAATRHYTHQRSSRSHRRDHHQHHHQHHHRDDDEDEDAYELDDGRPCSPFELLDGGEGEGEVGVEEEEEAAGSGGGGRSLAGLKRSHEMIFQPEPHPLAAAADSPESEGSLPDERLLASSLEDGSVASMASVRTVLEAASPRGPSPQQPQVVVAGEKSTADSGTSTAASGRPGAPLASVTITTSSVAEHGVQSVCTQVTSQARVTQGHSNGPTQVDFVPEYDLEVADSPPGSSPPAPCAAPTPARRPGHRRSESRAPAPAVSAPPLPTVPSSRGDDDRVECDLSLKEATQREEERKEVDEAEPESYHTEADQGFHRDLRERRAAAAAAASIPEDDLDEVEREVQRAALVDDEDDDEEDIPELDQSRPQSQVSKSDSEGHRPISSGFSDDRPDSELAELLKQCSGEGGRLGEDEEDDLEDPIERPPSPEPADLPDEPCVAAAATTGRGVARDVAEAEAVFRGVGRGAVHAVPSPGATPPIPEDLEPPTPPPVTAQAEALPPRASPIPDITVTQHMTPLVDRSFHYPDLELEEQEMAAEAEGTAGAQAAQTPASASSRASSATDTDQGREYVLGEEDGDDFISEEPELTRSMEMSVDMTASAVSDLTSTEERTVYEAAAGSFEPSPSHGHGHRQPPAGDEQSPPGSASPGSDSFELVEKPDLTDDYVVIEEVGREADEEDTEGKSVRIGAGGGGGASGAARARGRSAPHAAPRRNDDDSDQEEPLAQSPPQPQTRLTRVAYYPDAPRAVDDLGPFPFEDSPPTGGEASSAPAATGHPPQPNVRHAGVRTAPSEPDPEVEAGKKWIEMQFQAEHAAALAYGYDMEFERGPLEDIKEEEANDFDQSSGRVGSMGSYQTSIGSFGSVKESFSSTPEYDVLAGRRFFTRSGEHDDVSMSSLQEFEQLERQLAMENARKRSHGSQDSLNGTGSSSGGRSAGSGSGSGSFGARAAAHAAAAAAHHLYSRSGQGDDVSLSSLKEFEGLESACIEAVRIETQARQEEAALLSEIEEGHESQLVSECESYADSASAGAPPPLAGESADSEDYERRMFEIDEIIRQAQCNVERFADTHERLEASSSSALEDAAAVQQQQPPPPPAHWRDAGDDATRTSSDSLEEAAAAAAEGPSSDSAKRGSTDSLDQRTVADRSADVMTTSADSIEFQMGLSSGLDPLTDSIELPPDAGALMVASADSLDLAGPAQASGAADSIEEEEEDEPEVSHPHGSSSSGRDGDLSSSGAELLAELRAGAPPRADYMLGSTDSLEPSSSTATHATYQYETDSVMSGSFTSGGSNTMVSSTDTLDPAGAAALDAADLLAAAARAGAGAWFEDAPGGGQAFVTEVIEPSADPDFSYTVRRTVELPPEVHSVTFRGPDSERALRDYVQRFAPGEDVSETSEEAADGSVHVKRVVQRRVVVRAEDAPPELLAAARHRPSDHGADSDRPHDPRSPPPPPSSAEAASHRTSAPRHASPVVETQGPGLTTAPRLTEDEDDATLLPVEGGGRSTTSSTTTTSTTTTVRDVDGSVMTTVTHLTEQRSDSSGSGGAADAPRPQ